MCLTEEGNFRNYCINGCCGERVKVSGAIQYRMLDRGQHCIKEAIEQNIEHDLKITDICRDADDDNIIACAVAAKADYLMTGDSDLLEIKSYKDFKIVTPRDFEAMFA